MLPVQLCVVPKHVSLQGSQSGQGVQQLRDEVLASLQETTEGALV